MIFMNQSVKTTDKHFGNYFSQLSDCIDISLSVMYLYTFFVFSLHSVNSGLVQIFKKHFLPLCFLGVFYLEKVVMLAGQGQRDYNNPLPCHSLCHSRSVQTWRVGSSSITTGVEGIL